MRQRRVVDPIAEQEQLLLAAINANNKEYLELYAKYFGSATDPRDIVMTELDGLGSHFYYAFRVAS